MADQSGLRGKLLRGAKRIAQVIYPELYTIDKKSAIRKLYVEQDRYPIFQLGDDTELLALEDRLIAFLEAHSMAAEAKAELAMSESKAVAPLPSKAALLPKAQKAAPPGTRRRRRARSPASNAAA